MEEARLAKDRVPFLNEIKNITGQEDPFGLSSRIEGGRDFRLTGIFIENPDTGEIYVCIQEGVRMEADGEPFESRTSVNIVDVNGNVVGNMVLPDKYDKKNYNIPSRSGNFKGTEIEPGNLSFEVKGVEGEFTIHAVGDAINMDFNRNALNALKQYYRK